MRTEKEVKHRIKTIESFLEKAVTDEDKVFHMVRLDDLNWFLSGANKK